MAEKEKKVEAVEEEQRVKVSPRLCAYSDREHTKLHIEIELPGVRQEDIDLKMHEDSFALHAERDEVVFVGSYATCCPVNPDKAEAVYNNGLLKVDVPYKDAMSDAKEIKIG